MHSWASLRSPFRRPRSGTLMAAFASDTVEAELIILTADIKVVGAAPTTVEAISNSEKIIKSAANRSLSP